MAGEDIQALNEATESPSEAQEVTDDNLDAAPPSDADTESDNVAETKATLLDAVRDAVAPVEETPEDTLDSDDGIELESSSERPIDGDVEANAADDPHGDNKEENRRYDEIPRFKQLREQRDTFKEGHEAYSNIRSFMDQSGLNDQEVAELYQLGALIKTDPQASIAHIDKLSENLKMHFGMTLPEDLQSQVDEGLVYPETASELAQSRSQVSRLEQQNSQLAEQRQAEVQTQSREILSNAVVDWEASVTKSDPDYAMKQSFVEDQVNVLVSQNGRPQTAQEAVKMADEALATVNERLKVMRPAKSSTRPNTSGHVSTNASPAPKTLAEAVRMAANG